MMTRILTAATLTVGFIAAAASNALVAEKADAGKAAKSCCEQNLTCCNPKSACCVADVRLGCCEKGMKCCAEKRSCCTGVQKCCIEGSACCDQKKACCGPVAGDKSAQIDILDAFGTSDTGVTRGAVTFLTSTAADQPRSCCSGKNAAAPVKSCCAKRGI